MSRKYWKLLERRDQTVEKICNRIDELKKEVVILKTKTASGERREHWRQEGKIKCRCVVSECGYPKGTHIRATWLAA